MEKNIYIGSGLLRKIRDIISLEKFSSLGILTDSNIESIWLSKIKYSLDTKTVDIIVPAGEKNKTVESAEMIWKRMQEAGCDRGSLLINVGGGMVGDLGGFAASTYMRGIDFLHVPTSLAAMVDASIGGKTAVDVGGIKNVVGTFRDPIAVVVDVETLETLPERELVSGFAEMIKHGSIASRTHFHQATSKKPKEFEKDEMKSMIADSIKIKLDIVKQDPQERGLRKVLNFGHTIGHAVESLSLETNNPLLHGEAVAIGMVAESRLAELLGMISDQEAKQIEEAIRNVGLPTRISGMSSKNLLSIVSADKKNRSGKILWSLPEKIGSVRFNIEAPNELVVKVIQEILI